MAPAHSTAIAEAAQWVTVPASAPVACAIAASAAASNSVMRANSGAASTTRSTTSGGTEDAPSVVCVPAVLMIGVKP